MIYEILMVVYVLISLALIGFVLIQQGKGADMGASFGSGGANTVLGTSGGNFMTKTTSILATIFFVICLILGNLTAQKSKVVDEWENLAPSDGAQQPIAPADGDVPVVFSSPSNVDVPAADGVTTTGPVVDSGQSGENAAQEPAAEAAGETGDK